MTSTLRRRPAIAASVDRSAGLGASGRRAARRRRRRRWDAAERWLDASRDRQNAPSSEKVETDDRDDHQGGGRDRELGERTHVGDPPRRPPVGAVGSRGAGRGLDRGRHPSASSGPAPATTERCAPSPCWWSLRDLPDGRPCVGVDRRTQPAHRVMNSGFDRPRRDAERLGDLVDGQVHVVVEHHDGAVLHGQSSEGALELVPIVDVAQRVGRVRWRRAPPGEDPNSRLESVFPRCSTHGRGPGTTRPRSGPGREVAEGLARCGAVPAASHPWRDRRRAGSCARRREARCRRRPQGARMPLRRPAAPWTRDSNPSLPPMWSPVGRALTRVWGAGSRERCSFSCPRRRPATGTMFGCRLQFVATSLREVGGSERAAPVTTRVERR